MPDDQMIEEDFSEDDHRMRALISTGAHVAGLLVRCKSENGPRPTDDRINAVVNSWNNARRSAEWSLSEHRFPTVCHAPEVPPEPWPKPAWRYRLLRLVGK